LPLLSFHAVSAVSVARYAVSAEIALSYAVFSVVMP